MSIFEIVMLVCFGISWPFSIHKTYTSRTTKGKSLVFLYVVLAGYAAGILHKIFYRFDGVIIFYIINFCLVAVDIAFYYRNVWIEKQAAIAA
jgi:hypothetical protein